MRSAMDRWVVAVAGLPGSCHFRLPRRKQCTPVRQFRRPRERHRNQSAARIPREPCRCLRHKLELCDLKPWRRRSGHPRSPPVLREERWLRSLYGLLLQREHSSVRNLPSDGSGIEIVGGEIGPGRPHRGKAAALRHEIDRCGISNEAISRGLCRDAAGAGAAGAAADAASGGPPAGPPGGPPFPTAWPWQLQLVERGKFFRNDVQEPLGGIDRGHAKVSAAIVPRR